MNKAYTSDASNALDEFALAKEHLDSMIGQLQSLKAGDWRHDETETFIQTQGRELCRLLYQGALHVRSQGEERRPSVTGEDKVVRGHFRRGCQRKLKSLFGEVVVSRNGYCSRNVDSRYPLDAALNLPKRKYTYGLQECVSAAVSQSAFDNALERVSGLLGTAIPKRQAEELVAEASQDFEAFYAQRAITPVRSDETVLVMSQDGKGINMRHADLREATRKAAESAAPRLSTRLGCGEKRNRKRMATVATVYDWAPWVRTSQNIIGPKAQSAGASRAKAENKRVWASVTAAMETVTEQIVQEALRRDPQRKRPWVMLVDGHKDQLRVIHRVFKRHAVDAPLILDFIHVLEYLWRAAWCFFDSDDKGQSRQAEKWVLAKAQALLEGRSGNVAAGIRIKASRVGLSANQLKTIDDVARYLTNHTAMLRYDEFLSKGYPIATGVIEGACRHLIGDRFEITGARWSLKTAEGILRLRAIRSSGDWVTYQAFHKKKEWERHHFQRFSEEERSAMAWK